MPNIYLVGTLDTKSAELAYLKALLDARSHTVKLVDISTTPHSHDADITASVIAGRHREGAQAVLGGSDRGTAVVAMTSAFADFCRANGADIKAIIGIGGGGGTAMITAGMRELPYGIPKIMVSTLASGDTSAYVDTSDIMMMPSITDIAGLNSISRMVLANAAHALLGMVDAGPLTKTDARPAVAMTMFGVTTPAVTELVRLIGDQFDPLVFHATGTGGRTMEKLLLEGRLEGLIDMTTTEIADEVCGGVLSAGPARLDAVAATKKPYVGAPGALDMVNFWGPQTVPEKFQGRKLYFHNSNVTLMRTTAEECAEIGRWIANKLNACKGPVRFLIPLKGFSALDIEGGAFFDSAADAAFVESLEQTLEATANRKIVRLPLHINAPLFARAALDEYLKLLET